MNQAQRILMLASVSIVLVIFVIIGCSRTNEPSIDEGEEESSTELALDETYDKIRNGARLILAYDAQSNAFKGTEVQLSAESTGFDGWTAHPEVGSGERSHGGEHSEHDSEHGGEHDGEGEGKHN